MCWAASSFALCSAAFLSFAIRALISSVNTKGVGAGDAAPTVQQLTKVRIGFALHAEKIFQAGHRIVAACQRAADRLQTLETQGILFTSIDHQDRLTLRELAQTLQGR